MALTKYLGNTPKIKILSYLLTVRELDVCLTDISREAKVSWTTLNREWSDLIELKLVKHTRAIGNAKLYQLDLDNEIVKNLKEIYDRSLSESLLAFK